MFRWLKSKKTLNQLRKEQGALVVEATFVYPIMLLIICFLLYMGNAYFMKAYVQNQVSAEAMTYAERFADPNYAIYNEGVTTTNDGSKITSELYRYIDVFNLGDYGVANEQEKHDFAERIERPFFFKWMTPSDITVIEHRVHNYVIYHSYEVSVRYQIRFPIRLAFTNEHYILDMVAREEVPVIDTPEFIRNVDMAIDFAERTKTGEKVSEKLSTSYEKIKKFINGSPRAPTEAVAGGAPAEAVTELSFDEFKSKSIDEQKDIFAKMSSEDIYNMIKTSENDKWIVNDYDLITEENAKDFVVYQSNLSKETFFNIKWPERGGYAGQIYGLDDLSGTIYVSRDGPKNNDKGTTMCIDSGDGKYANNSQRAIPKSSSSVKVGTLNIDRYKEIIDILEQPNYSSTDLEKIGCSKRTIEQMENSYQSWKDLENNAYHKNIDSIAPNVGKYGYHGTVAEWNVGDVHMEGGASQMNTVFGWNLLIEAQILTVSDDSPVSIN